MRQIFLSLAESVVVLFCSGGWGGTRKLQELAVQSEGVLVAEV